MSLISTTRKVALSGVSIVAIGMGAASAQTAQSVFAGDIGADQRTLELSDYAARAINDQWQQGGADITASIVGSLGGVTGPQTSGDVNASDNLFEVAAIGNTTDNLAEDGTDGTVGLGNRILSSQVVGSHAALSDPVGVMVTAAARPDTTTTPATPTFIGVRNEGLLDDTVTVSGNGVVAEVRLNDAVNSLAGVSSQDTSLAQGTASTTITYPDLSIAVDAGSPAVPPDTPAVPATGPSAGSIDSDIASAFNSLHNVQQSIASGTIAGSGAKIETTIELVNDAADAAATPPVQDVTGIRSLEGNSQTASYRGNAAVNAVRDTDSTQVRGSTIVSSVQVNVEDGSVSNSRHSAHVVEAGIFAELTNVDDMNGTLSVSGNVNAADTVGNEATNTMVFADSAEVTGTGGDAVATVNHDTATVTLTADFGISNIQANRDTLLRSMVFESGIYAEIAGDGVDGGNVNGGLVSVSENAISASVAGNDAVNIVPIVNASSLSATAAVANYQTNAGTPIHAFVTRNDIYIRALGSVGGDATLSISGNTRSATATANASENAVVIQAQTVSAAGTGRAAVDADAGAGLGVTNVQVASGDRRIWAGVFNSGVYVTVGDVAGSTVSVQGNTSVASATANEATSTIDATGANGALSAFVANQQGSGSKVSAEIEYDGAWIGTGDLSGTTASVTDNLVAAVASGNSASNGLSASDFTDLALGNSSAPANFGRYSASSSEADAALALVSNHFMSASVSAETTPDSAESAIVIDAASVESSTLSAAGNSLRAIASGNDADNELIIGSDDLTTQDELVAALVNSQSIEATATVTASVEGRGIDVDIGVRLKNYDASISGSGVVAGTVISVSDNAVVAAADGNIADNVLLVTGTTHQRDTDMTRSADDRNFVLSNSQTTGAGTDAKVEGLRIGVFADSTAASMKDDGMGNMVIDEDSTLSIAGNEVIAQARNNVAINRLDFGRDSADADDSRSFTGLKTTALVENMQENSGTATAAVDDVDIVVDLLGNGATSDTDFAVTGNRLIAAASGNVADNSLNIAAQTLMNGANGMDDSYGVSNVQTNSGAIKADILNGPKIGYNNQGLGSSNVSGTTMSVNRNLIAAEAYGNNAGNAYNVAALSSDQVRGGVSNTQTNSGSVSALVTGLDIGVTTGDSITASGGLSSVRGNSVTATAVGNRAVNRVSRTN